MKSFKIKFHYGAFNKGDILMMTSGEAIEVLSTPSMHYWERFKKFIGISHEEYYKVYKKGKHGQV